MEAYFGYLESSLIGIPMPLRQLFILASRKLMNRVCGDELLDAYIANLIELYIASPRSELEYVQALEMCIEAYGLTLGSARNGRIAV
jgi:hypothetical protein